MHNLHLSTIVLILLLMAQIEGGALDGEEMKGIDYEDVSKIYEAAS
jgi:hypothetical protein